jgi:hypothetical protein
MSVANSFNPTYASSFQALDESNVYVLGQNGNLWLEHGVGDGLVQSTPPPRELVDQNVRAFQAIDANNVFVLGTDGNLWREHSVNGKAGLPSGRSVLARGIGDRDRSNCFRRASVRRAPATVGPTRLGPFRLRIAG